MSNAGASRLPVVEEFYSLQGEGANAGIAAWFIRLGGCDVCCPWCDTAYSWHADEGSFAEAEDIAARAAASGAATAVITGGEPAMHPLEQLTGRLHEHGLRILLETSGAHVPRGEFDWVCLSPKSHRPPVAEALAMADELKVVAGCEEDLRWAEECASKVPEGCLLFLQPEWGRRSEAVPMITEYVKAHPRWRVSLQLHKFLNIP